jgi:hypothetical protein
MGQKFSDYFTFWRAEFYEKKGGIGSNLDLKKMQ